LALHTNEKRAFFLLLQQIHTRTLREFDQWRATLHLQKKKKKRISIRTSLMNLGSTVPLDICKKEGKRKTNQHQKFLSSMNLGTGVLLNLFV
jgi:hypothetical protein